MRRAFRILTFFLVMYLIATVLGFATYLLISPLAMWVCVFTIMPVVAALLIYRYLTEIGSTKDAIRDTTILVAAWIALSFLLDAITYIFLIPAATHQPRNWTFFVDQSPWIWLSYAVLLGSGLAANRLYAQRKKAASA